jgi:hypothetical protein
VMPTAFAIRSMPSRNSSCAAFSYFICFAVIVLSLFECN